MTTAEIIAEAKARGFRFVETLAGRIPLDQFDPYGTGAGTPDILSWSWLNWTQAVDGPRECLAGFSNGKWTFYKTETDFF